MMLITFADGVVCGILFVVGVAGFCRCCLVSVAECWLVFVVVCCLLMLLLRLLLMLFDVT